MADKRDQRIAELIEPLRVKPGSKVKLARDFDPAYKLPGNAKGKGVWQRRYRLCAAAVLVHTLVGIDPRYPQVSAEQREQLLLVKDELEAQAPGGAAADPFAAWQAKENATVPNARVKAKAR